MVPTLCGGAKVHNGTFVTLLETCRISELHPSGEWVFIGLPLDNNWHSTTTLCTSFNGPTHIYILSACPQNVPFLHVYIVLVIPGLMKITKLPFALVAKQL